jgi:pyruvate dehydrogenase E2 component (dihydrolipoamide acetyltransferase)
VAETVGMPRLSDSMEEGTVLKWLVEEGGEVKRGEPLVEIETDKANMTYEADTDGVLIKVIANEGDTLPVGDPIAEIGEEGEAPSGGGGEQSGEEESGGEAKADEPEAEEPEDDDAQDGEADGAQDEKDEQPEGEADEDEQPEAEESEEPKPEAPDSGGNGGERIKASPVARRMAGELGVELARLEGSGPGGRIVKADVESAAEDGSAAKTEEKDEEAPAEAPAAKKESSGAKGEVEVQELSRLQQTVTRRMAESKATAPDFALTLDVDMTEAVKLRKRLKEVADPAPSFNDMIVKASALALSEFPKVNGAYRDGRFELYEKVNVGIAVAAEGTLVVPTIFGADTRSLGDIAKSARQAIEKVRSNEITPPEVSGGTFTVSNLGMFGIERFTAIINPPQAALLTVGSLEKKPAVDDRERVVVRDQLTLTLVCDHRILYGADGAQFLARVRELLEQPLSLAL